MFPGAGAVVYRNEDGEPTGWDTPGAGGPPWDDYDPYVDGDDDAEDYVDEEPDREPTAADEEAWDARQEWIHGE